MEGKKCPMGIFADLSRAFDCVDVSLLLRKLEMYGIRGPALAWLSSFLRDKNQFVSLLCNDCSAGQDWLSSDVLSINTGVPQGSVLGPFLFITYINDLTNMIDSNWTVTLLADFSSFIMSTDNENMERTCIAGLGTIFHWFSNNSLFLNCSKTTYMRFHTTQNKQNLDINFLQGNIH